MFNPFSKEKKEEKNPAAGSEESPKDAGQPSASEKSKSAGPAGLPELDKNIEIHVMPERFRFRHEDSRAGRRMGMIILLGGIGFVIILLAFAYYYFFVKSAKPQDQQADSQKQAEEISEEAKTEENAEEQKLQEALSTYLSFKNKIGLVRGLDGYEALVESYGSANFAGAWKIIKTKVNGLGEDSGQEFINLLKNFYPAAAGLESGLKPVPSQEKVFLKTGSLNSSVNIEMVYEEDEWKVNEENGFVYFDEKENATTTIDLWIEEKAAALASSSGEIKLELGADSDGDGLLDAEEAMLGTDLNLADSDGDGYGDLTEVENLYNPGGEGKLEENKGLGKYTNEEFGYRIIRPSGWELSQVGGPDSIILSSPDNNFFQITVQADSEGINVFNWYKEMFGADEIEEFQIVSNQKGGEIIWQGVRTLNELAVYLTDENLEYIFAISYNPGEQSVLDYQNIFEVLVRSFEFTK